MFLVDQITPELLEVATVEERQHIRTALLKEKALLSPLDFLCYVEPDTTVRYPHTELINRYSVALINHALYPSGIGLPAVWTPKPDDPDDGAWLHPSTGEEAHRILVLSIPPQHGKSYIVTETLPAWYLLRNPDHRVVVTGYEADFARGFGRKNRAKIQKVPEFGISVDSDTRAADEWDLEGHTGGLITAGSGGPITGKGAHVMIVDDPVKNSVAALSAAERKINWEWWKSTVTSRGRGKYGSGGVIILIQTRWHEADLAGMVVKHERCFELNVPALAYDGDPDPVDGVARDPETGERDPLGRKPGEALCPALHNRSYLISRRESNDESDDEPGGMLWFSALYQGKPNIEGGGIIGKPYRYFWTDQNQQGQTTYQTKDLHGKTKTFLQSDCIHFITSDLATSLKTRADWTVFSNFAWTPDGDILYIAQFRTRLESPDHPAEATRFFQEQRRACGNMRFLGVENKTFGTALIQDLVREGEIPVMPLEADTDKVARAIPVGMRIKADRFFLPAEAEWLKDTEHEMQLFPNGQHDDVVDTLGYAVSASKFFPIRKVQEQDHPLTMQDKVAAMLEARLTKRPRRQRHDMLGRM